MGNKLYYIYNVRYCIFIFIDKRPVLCLLALRLIILRPLICPKDKYKKKTLLMSVIHVQHYNVKNMITILSRKPLWMLLMLFNICIFMIN